MPLMPVVPQPPRVAASKKPPTASLKRRGLDWFSRWGRCIIVLVFSERIRRTFDDNVGSKNAIARAAVSAARAVDNKSTVNCLAAETAAAAKSAATAETTAAAEAAAASPCATACAARSAAATAIARTADDLRL